MAKNLNVVNMMFTADTSQARKELKNLQDQLTSLANTPVSLSGGNISKEILSASNAAAELKVHLSQAMNMKTGTLDFTKLNSSIKQSGMSLSEYGEKLRSLGPAGNTAFQSLATSVSKAEIPIRRSNAALTEMWATLKNTARWQISSSILHGFMGAVQSAYGYAQDLNESLNNIRIVTGQNVDQMARFAEQANKAAKALSTSTTEYTNASLIYYQQGLNDSEVQQRTNITIKMANAAGESAETVSDQLTAVWNNFAKGGENLEYYADVMTALGAATASSTDEIAQGLEKFASIADTVGLSYEYATSALATVTATTRQSADVVGTAFKTLFARIQDLELGETLDDGTTLGKYSEALYAVGIDIKTAGGELKKMDQILDELGSKWDTLSKDTQVAVAQTVAGVRQYTQMIALMDNWDFMEENLQTAYNSTGTLQEQADIYAESWEAASKRVKSATEALYSNIIKDDFMIDILNGFEKFLTLIDRVMDSMGGIGGMLAGISALVLKLASGPIAQGITNMVYSMKMLTESGRQAVQAEQQLFVAEAAESLNPSEFSTMEGQTREASMKNQLEIQSEMIIKSEKMSGIELEVNKILADRIRLLGEESAKRAQTLDEAQEQVASSVLDLRARASVIARNEAGSDVGAQAEEVKKANALVTEANGKTKSNIRTENVINKQIDEIRGSGEITAKNIDILTKKFEKLQYKLQNGDKEKPTFLDDILKDLEHMGGSADEAEDQLRRLQAAARKAVSDLAERDYGKAGIIVGEDEPDLIEDTVESFRVLINAEGEHRQSVNTESQAIEDLKNRLNNVTGVQRTWADTIVSTTQGISSMAMGIASLSSAFETLSNPDMSAWDKFTSITMSLSMGLPMLMTGFSNTWKSLSLMNAAMLNTLGIKSSLLKAYGAENVEILKGIVLNQSMTQTEKLKQIQESLSLSTKEAKIALEGGEAVFKTKNIALTLAETIGIKAKTIAEKIETGGIIANTAAKIANLAATAPLLVATIAMAAAFAALVAVIALVVSGIKTLTNIYNKDKQGAENAANAAKNLANAYTEVKQKYEDMISTMENYNSARDGLDSLTVGTEEYRNKLNEANEEALKLIKLLGLIKDEGYIIKDGEIIINEKSNDYITKSGKLYEDTQYSYATSKMANAQKDVAEAKKEQTDLVRKDDQAVISNLVSSRGAHAALLGSTVGGIVGGTGGTLAGGGILSGLTGVAGAKAGAGLGGLIGTAFGSLWGLGEGILINRKNNKTDQENIDKLTEQYKKDGNSAFDESNLDALGFKDASDEYIESLKKIVEANAEGAAGLEAATELAASAILDLNDKIESSPVKDQVIDAGTVLYDKEFQTQYDTYMEDLKNANGLASLEQKDLFEQYAKEALKGLKYVEATNFRGDGIIEYSYQKQNDDGTTSEETGKVSNEEIAAYFASDKANELLKNSSDTLITLFNRLDSLNTKQTDAIAGSLSKGDLSDLSFDDLESFSNISTDEIDNISDWILSQNPDAYKEAGYESIEAYKQGMKESIETDQDGMASKVFTEIVKVGLSEEELKAFGYETAEEFATAFQQQYDEAMEEWDGLKTFKDFSLGEAKTLDKFADQSGQTDQYIADYYATLNDDEKELFLQIDFNKEKTKENWDAALAELKEEKIEVLIEGKTQEGIEKFDLDADQVNDVAKAFSELDKITKNGKESMENIASSSADAAERYVRLQDAVLDLSENYDDYKQVLKDVKKADNDYAKALITTSENGKKLKSSLAALLGTTEDLIDADLLSAIDPEDFDKASKGDEAAIERIRNAFIDLQAKSIVKADIDVEEFKGSKEDAEAEIQEFKNMMDGLTEGATIDIDESPFLQALIQSQLAAGATAADIENLLAGFDIDADVTGFTEAVDQAVLDSMEASDAIINNLSFQEDVQTQATTTEAEETQATFDENVSAENKKYDNVVLENELSDGKPVKTNIWELNKGVEVTPVTGTSSNVTTSTTKNVKNGAGKGTNNQVKAVKISNAKKSVGSTVDSSTKTAAKKNRAGKSGGGGDKKKASPTKKSDIVERYKEVTDRLDETSRKAEKAARTLERERGKDQKKAIKDLVKQESKEIEDLKVQRDEAKEYRKKDKKELNKEVETFNKMREKLGLKGEGLKFSFDNKNKNITNYTEQLTKAYEELAKMEKDAGDEWSKADAEKIESFKKQIESIEAARKEYDKTNKTFKDLNDQLDEMKGKDPLKTIKSEIVDVFHEANEELDKLNRNLSQIERKADSSTGAERIKYLKEAAKIEEDIAKNLKSQQATNAKDITNKKEALTELAGKSGLSFTFDAETGSITNYDAQMQTLYDAYEAKKKEYSKDGEITNAEQTVLDDLKGEMDEIQSYVDQYSAAVKKGRDLVDDEAEAILQAKDKMATALSESLEFKIEINDRDMRRIEYSLNKIGDDFYKAAEGAALMSSKMNISQDSLESYAQSKKEWDAKLAEKKVDPSDYAEAMKSISDGIYDSLEAINELDSEMMDYYGNTLAAAGEEIAKYTDRMEHQSSVLEHYSSIMSIMGKSTDYKKMGKILEGQSKVMEDQTKAAKANLNFYQDQANARKAEYETALTSGNQAAIDFYKKQYDDALAAVDEAEEDYLSKAEAYAENLTAIFENKLADLGQTLENALTGGTSFDSLNDKLSRAASLQENYLTTTNQIYETNKLMRTAQQEIDKSSNSVAKNKLKQFIAETEQMQNQNKLSQYELNVQQEKYNLLLAEIALEEAQAAKSTVRLQRDKDGNFGYVYTADTSQVSEAEQKVADSQNRLYNMGLEGANDYTNKYEQTMSEMYDTLNDLNEKYRSGEIESETEFNNEVLAAKNYYYAKLEEYSSLYALAVQTDSHVIADAWSSQFSSMISNTEEWKTKVNGYIDNIKGAFNTWKGEMATIESDLGLGNIDKAINDIKSSSEALLTELTKDDGVLDKVTEELGLVVQVTGAWASQRSTIQGLVGDYEALAGSIDETIKTMLSLTPQNGEQTGGGNNTGNLGDQTITNSAEVGNYVAIKSGTKLYKDVNGKEELQMAGPAGTIKSISATGEYAYNIDGIGWIKKTDIVGFDTGGYTGDWAGSYGKMALLHQKEMVLNSQDTANLLLSLDVLNKIIDAIDLQAANAQLGGILNSPSYNQQQEKTLLEQQVHIEASFPSVTDHNELEEAFNNLINQASQYANRK